MKTLLMSLSFLLLTARCCAQADTFYVYFATGSVEIAPLQKKSIDNIVRRWAVKAAEKLTIVGFADHRGIKGDNDTLSQNRAKAVAAELEHAGIPRLNIVLCEGRGAIAREGKATNAVLQRDRKVMVLFSSSMPAGVPATRADSFFANPNNIKVDATYTLDILFALGSLQVLKRCMPELKSLLSFMKDNSSVTIRIEGHVCCPTGSAASQRNGQSASEARAKFVRDYLVTHGVDSARVTYMGFGATRPLVTPELDYRDAQRNRRVDVRIVHR